MYYSLECFWHYIAQWLAQMHFETHTHTPLSRIVLTIIAKLQNRDTFFVIDVET